MTPETMVKSELEKVRMEDMGSESDADSSRSDTFSSQLGGDGDFELIATGKHSRGEKKARKIIRKLGLKQIPDVNCVTIRKSKDIMFVINHPEVYHNPNSETYIILGEIQIKNMSLQAKLAAAKKFKATKAPAVGEINDEGGEDDDEEADATGVDEKDIELVILQAGTTRSKAIKALKNNDNDIVNAIMELTAA
ncbi:hypothetical protein KR018_012085 [Drosophila ironensis]|nr:hypothetical protein KR018_012085 [Drosophila ironensis]